MLSFLNRSGSNAQLPAWLLPAWLWLCLILGGASQGGVLANMALQGSAACIIAYWLWSDGRLQLQRA